MSRSTVTLFGKGGETREVSARIFGVWAVHETWPGIHARPAWTVTHVPTGAAAAYETHQVHAVDIALGLHRELPDFGADLGLGDGAALDLPRLSAVLEGLGGR